MPKVISDIHAKVSAVVSKTHAAVKSHTLIAVYLAILAVVAIPLVSHIWDYWRPVLQAYKVVGPAETVKIKGRM